MRRIHSRLITLNMAKLQGHEYNARIEDLVWEQVEVVDIVQDGLLGGVARTAHFALLRAEC